MIIANKTHTK